MTRDGTIGPPRTDSGPPVPVSGSTDGSPPESSADWPTPRAEHDSGRHRGQTDTLHSRMKQASAGKLNPAWVETLMGLPLGHTQLPAKFVKPKAVK